MLIQSRTRLRHNYVNYSITTTTAILLSSNVKREETSKHHHLLCKRGSILYHALSRTSLIVRRLFGMGSNIFFINLLTSIVTIPHIRSRNLYFRLICCSYKIVTFELSNGTHLFNIVNIKTPNAHTSAFVGSYGIPFSISGDVYRSEPQYVSLRTCFEFLSSMYLWT